MTEKNKEISYQEALKELEAILEDLQEETVDVDHLSEKLKRAYELIAVCRAKIKSAETEVKKINQKFSQK